MGDRAHAAHHVAVKSLLFVFASAEQVKQQAEGGSGLVRSTVLAVHVVREEERLDFLRFVVAIEEVPQAPGEKRDKLRDFRAGDAAKAFADSEQVVPALP